MPSLLIQSFSFYKIFFHLFSYSVTDFRNPPTSRSRFSTMILLVFLRKSIGSKPFEQGFIKEPFEPTILTLSRFSTVKNHLLVDFCPTINCLTILTPEVEIFNGTGTPERRTYFS